MPTITKPNWTQEFIDIQAVSNSIGEKNDCGVVAVALVTGCGYNEAHRQLKLEGRRRHGCSKRWMYDAVLKRIGYEREDVTDYWKRRAKTIISFGRVVDRHSYMVHISGHVLAVTNGQVHDWTKGRRHRIQKVYKIKQIQQKISVASADTTLSDIFTNGNLIQYLKRSQ